MKIYETLVSVLNGIISALIAGINMPAIITKLNPIVPQANNVKDAPIDCEIAPTNMFPIGMTPMESVIIPIARPLNSGSDTIITKADCIILKPPTPIPTITSKIRDNTYIDEREKAAKANNERTEQYRYCLLYTSPSPRDQA